MAKLRLEVCSNCCFNCYFCHGDQVCNNNFNNQLTAADYGFLTKVAKTCGFKKVAVAGGEPLIKNDIVNILEQIKNNNVKVQLTTNGYMLNVLNACNVVDSINLSIHSLDLTLHEKITNKKFALPIIIENLYEFKQLHPQVVIKFNVVALKNKTWTEENLKQLLNFCVDNNITLKFIELLDGSNPEFVSVEQMESDLKSAGFKRVGRQLRNTYLSNGTANVILQQCFCSYAKSKPNTREICNKYNDLFILSNGDVQLCRNSNKNISLYNAIVNRNKLELKTLILQAKKMLGEHCNKKD